ncbi:MAG TPA: beta-N-acetylhexosaminidase [Herpetosiphonaceae bacterium]|nr:beta-N-acetylhexosaminidase [Herpetosiphonaceae bacterium]
MNGAYRDLAGQSVMLSFTGTRVTRELVGALERTRAGGVILFARNIGSPAELYALTGALQEQAAMLRLPPLLIGIDQEGGPVTRLRPPFATVPSQMAQAASADPAAAYHCAVLTGRQLRAFGINLNFAPVLDVNCNPDNPVIGTRAFSEDAAAVTRLGLEALRGYREAGVVATGKHFPGHGDTALDSHLGLPVMRHPCGRLDEMELAPFVAAFRAGLPAVMTAHIVFEVLDALPATLSRSILTELLRDELQFDGVVFTDALDMQAISGRYGAVEAGLRSKAAGADVLLPLGSLDEQVAVVEALQSAITDGSLSRSVFEATARRLDALREAYGVDYTLPPFSEPGAEEYAEALEVGRRSVTVTRGAAALPLAKGSRVVLIDCMLPRFSQAEEALERSELLRDLVGAAFPRATSLALGPELADEEVVSARAMAETCDATLLVTRNAYLIERQARLARTLAASGVPLIHAAVRNPYDAAVVPDSTATLLTYGDPEVSLQALVEVLGGDVPAQGVLPVSLGLLDRKEGTA